MSDTSAALAQLQRLFGNLDKDVLGAVLEVCGGDAKEAAKYLQAQDGGGYDPRTLNTVEGGIPQDYPGQKKSSSSRGRGPFPSSSKEEEKTPSAPTDATPAEKMKALFLNDNVSLQDHLDNQNKDYNLYTSVLVLLINQGVEISKASRPRILAAAYSRKDKELPEYLLSKEDLFSLPHVLGALVLLDAGRRVRAIEKKIARLEKQGTVKAKKLGQLKSTINDLKREAHIGSVSGALSKHIRKWVQNIDSEKLEFYALNMPKAPWCELADIIHINPKDFQCPWFLEYVFGKEAPSDSLVNVCKTLTAENLVSVLANHKIPYSYLRLNVKPLPEAAKVIIANYAPLDTVIWYYEELANADVDKVLDSRLDKEVPTFGYGKLMERLLYFKSINAPFFKKLIPIAEERMARIDLQLEAPVVVIGDASYSMDVAIRVSTVIASVLTVLCGAELKFFTGESVDPPVVPRNIPQVLEVASGVKADGLTAPAAALYPYYIHKKIVKFFIVVTDEVENEKYKDYYFPTLFQKYHKEVYPAKIVFVSFLENPSEKGRMVTALESMGIVPLQFKLDGKRPDLTKLDSILGLLASESSFFNKQAEEHTNIFKEKGLKGLLHKLSQPKVRNVVTATAPSELKEEEKGGKSEEKKPDENSKKYEGVNLKEGDGKFCVICEERQVDTALLECGHLSFCGKCAEALKDCPICRAKVVRAVKIYQNA